MFCEYQFSVKKGFLKKADKNKLYKALWMHTQVLKQVKSLNEISTVDEGIRIGQEYLTMQQNGQAYPSSSKEA